MALPAAQAALVWIIGKIVVAPQHLLIVRQRRISESGKGSTELPCRSICPTSRVPAAVAESKLTGRAISGSALPTWQSSLVEPPQVLPTVGILSLANRGRHRAGR